MIKQQKISPRAIETAVQIVRQSSENKLNRVEKQPEFEFYYEELTPRSRYQFTFTLYASLTSLHHLKKRYWSRIVGLLGPKRPKQAPVKSK